LKHCLTKGNGKEKVLLKVVIYCEGNCDQDRVMMVIANTVVNIW